MASTDRSAALRRANWWARQGLNLRPHPCEGCALPLELRARPKAPTSFVPRGAHPGSRHVGLRPARRWRDGEDQAGPVHCSRRRAIFGRSCSTANRVFFEGHSRLAHDPPYRSIARHHPVRRPRREASGQPPPADPAHRPANAAADGAAISARPHSFGGHFTALATLTPNNRSRRPSRSTAYNRPLHRSRRSFEYALAIPCWPPIPASRLKSELGPNRWMSQTLVVRSAHSAGRTGGRGRD